MGVERPSGLLRAIGHVTEATEKLAKTSERMAESHGRLMEVGEKIAMAIAENREDLARKVDRLSDQFNDLKKVIEQGTRGQHIGQELVSLDKDLKSQKGDIEDLEKRCERQESELRWLTRAVLGALATSAGALIWLVIESMVLKK